MIYITISIVIFLIGLILWKILSKKRKPSKITETTKSIAQEILQRWLRSLKPGESYEELLKRPEWHTKAIRIKERDSWRCAYCGNVCDLEVHHKYYSRYPNDQKVAPWNYPDDALITLCHKCHEKVHQTKTIKLYYRKYTDNYD